MRIILAPIIAATLLGGIRADSCEDLCKKVDECAQCPMNHGSYCKSWETPNVCFGLYYTDETKTSMCFASNPHVSNCPETYPVPCPSS